MLWHLCFTKKVNCYKLGWCGGLSRAFQFVGIALRVGTLLSSFVFFTSPGAYRPLSVTYGAGEFSANYSTISNVATRNALVETRFLRIYIVSIGAKSSLNALSTNEVHAKTTLSDLWTYLNHIHHPMWHSFLKGGRIQSEIVNAPLWG